MFEHFGVINYYTYVIGAIAIILLPGPNSLYVLTLAAQQGRQKGWAAALAIFLGDLILMLATIAGAATFIEHYPQFFEWLRIAGALYLTYLGAQLIYNAVTTWRQNPEQDLSNLPILKSISPYQAFRKALIISLLNPKAILFFLSFFLQFVNPEYDQKVIPFLILIITIQALSLFYLWALIVAGERLAKTFSTMRRTRAISSAGVGGGFIGFAFKLALASV